MMQINAYAFTSVGLIASSMKKNQQEIVRGTKKEDLIGMNWKEQIINRI